MWWVEHGLDQRKQGMGCEPCASVGVGADRLYLAGVCSTGNGEILYRRPSSGFEQLLAIAPHSEGCSQDGPRYGFVVEETARGVREGGKGMGAGRRRVRSVEVG